MAEEILDPDIFPDNADWLRTLTWDLWHAGRLVETLADLEAELDLPLEQFMKLPAARAMPAGLRKQVERKLKKV